MNRANKSASWKCKDGRIVIVRDMEDQHLLNTIRISAWAYADDAPDGASVAAEIGTEQAMEEAETLDGIEREYPVYKQMIAEAKFRNLCES